MERIQAMKTNEISKSITPSIVKESLVESGITAAVDVGTLVKEIHVANLQSKVQLVDILTRFVGSAATEVADNIFELLKMEYHDDSEYMKTLQTFILNSDQMSDTEKITQLNNQKKSENHRKIGSLLTKASAVCMVIATAGLTVGEAICKVEDHSNRHSFITINRKK
jgi:hypothetical protein